MANPANRFGGVAYWKLANVPDDWYLTVEEVLKPLVAEGMASVGILYGDGDRRTLEVKSPEGEVLSLWAQNGEGRGVVNRNDSAVLFVIVLMAIRKQLPCLSLADDNPQRDFPWRVRQEYPLFAEHWSRAQEVASILGFMPSQRFLEQDGAVMQLMF